MLLLYINLVSTDSDRDFVVRIYTNLNRRLLGYAFKLSGDRQWAQDGVQQVFLELIHNLHKYNKMTDDDLGKYCFTIVRNAFYRQSKQNARLGDLELLDEDLGGDGTAIDDALMQQVEREEIKHALAALSEAHRMIVIQKFFFARTHSEIAREMGISESQSQNLLAAAMKEIRTTLGVKISNGKK